jgi:succinate dehydrogenase/fumarate reductase flavoprotein subunit
MNSIQEPTRTIPITNNYDVLVCGGGPAGIAAALSAARAGAHTGLIELHGCLGGIWTTGLLSCILDHKDKTGIMAEIWSRLEERNARAIDHSGQPTNTYDAEEMKLLLDQLCLEAGIDIHLHTRVVSAVKENDRLVAAITESASGRQAVAASTFIDCTGDGSLSALADCSFDLGHPDTGATQPMSLMALLTGLRAADIDGFYRVYDQPWATPKDLLRAEMERGGHSPSYAKPTLFRMRDDLFALMANHEYGVKGTDARDLTAATLRARRELHQLIDGLRSLGAPWADLRIVATGAQIGVREGRRIHGRYTVSDDDLRTGARHDDAVCHVTFPIDIHSTNPGREKGIEQKPFKSQPYDIPLPALVARDVDGLMMAGRCISGDFIAHSSYRVTGNAVTLGDAAGRVAARAASTDRLPHEVTWEEVKPTAEAPA